MQDRFKFRFWRYNPVQKKEVIISADLMNIDGSADPYDNGEGGSYCYFDDCICEQCTGLKDKNGKLIYEGDIIERNGMYRKVFWIDDEGGFGYEPHTLFEPLQTDECVIAGNIHENPELLEKRDE